MFNQLELLPRDLITYVSRVPLNVFIVRQS
uniref:Uncharacterized protein n=1 Tax=Anguilla anguilla TaxID=7936 RepID=A0A0E9R385_ANGAN